MGQKHRSFIILFRFHLIADIKDTPAVNEVYSRYFQVNPPARACYEVGCLPKNALVEIEAIAIKENSLDEIVSKL